MHESHIPGWRALVKELIPFYRENVCYLVVVSVLMGLLAMLPLVVVIAVYAVLAFTGAGSDTGNSIVRVVFVVVGLAAFAWLVFMVGATQIASVNAAFDGKTVSLRKLIRGSLDVRRSLNVVAGMVAYGFLVVVGFLCFVIPGVYLLARGAYLPYALVRENLPAFKAVERSWELTKGYTLVTVLRFGWVALAAGAGSAVIALLFSLPAASLARGIVDMAWQVLVVSPFAMIFSRRMYEEVRDRKAQSASAFHRLTDGEKLQMVGAIVLMFFLGSMRSFLLPRQSVGVPVNLDFIQGF